jgi:hypothetical protein
MPFPHYLPLAPTLQTGYVKKEKEKTWHSCLFKKAIQRVSLWHFHVYTYYNLNWFYFSPFYFSLLLMVISTRLKILYLFL